MKPLWGSFLYHIATSCCRILNMHEGGTQEYMFYCVYSIVLSCSRQTH